MARDTKTGTNKAARTNDQTKAAEAVREAEVVDASAIATGVAGPNTAPLGGWTMPNGQTGKLEASKDVPAYPQAVAPLYPEGVDGNQTAIAEHSTELAEEQNPAPTGDNDEPTGTEKPNPPESSSV